MLRKTTETKIYENRCFEKKTEENYLRTDAPTNQENKTK